MDPGISVSLKWKIKYGAEEWVMIRCERSSWYEKFVYKITHHSFAIKFHIKETQLNILFITLHKKEKESCLHIFCGKISCDNLWHHLSHIMRKPVYATCLQQRCISACAFAHSDQRLCYLLPRYYNTSCFYIRNCKHLASLCSRAGQFGSYLVAIPRPPPPTPNTGLPVWVLPGRKPAPPPEDRFAHGEAHFMICNAKETMVVFSLIGYWQCYDFVDTNVHLAKEQNMVHVLPLVRNFTLKV